MTDLTEADFLESLNLEAKLKHMICKNSHIQKISICSSKIISNIKEKSSNRRKAFSKAPKKKLIKLLFLVVLLKKFSRILKKSIGKDLQKSVLIKKGNKLLINDSTYFLEGYSDKPFVHLKNLKNFTKDFSNRVLKPFIWKSFVQLCKKIPIFENFSIYLRIWDFFQCVIMLILTVMIPMNAFIENSDLRSNHLSNILIYLSIFSFSMDILINFNTSFVKNGVSIKNRKKILFQYMKKDLYKDLLGLFSLIFYENCIFSLFLFIFKMPKLKKFINHFEMNHISKISTKIYWKLLKTLVFLFLLAHYIACFWAFLGQWSSLYYRETWMDEKNLKDGTVGCQYIYSLYYSVAILLLDDTNMIVPQNELEILSTICFKIIGLFNILYIFHSVGYIISQTLKRKDKTHENLRIMNQYLKTNKISEKTRKKLKSYLKHKFKKIDFESKSKKQNQIIANMPENLRNELLQESLEPLISKIPALTNNFSEKSLKKLQNSFQKSKFLKNHIIFNQGDIDDKSLFLILKGNVSISFENNHIQTKKKNDIFGVFSFFSNMSRRLTVKALTNTTVLQLKQEDFVKIIKEFPDEYEKYCEIRDKININNDFKDLHVACKSCSSMNHDELNCPLNHFIPNRQQIIDKKNWSFKENNRRKEIQRKKQRKIMKFYKNNKDFSSNKVTIDEEQSENEQIFSNISDSDNGSTYNNKKAFEKNVIWHDENYSLKMKLSLKHCDIDLIKTNNSMGYFAGNHFEKVICEYNEKIKRKINREYGSNILSKSEWLQSFDEISINNDNIR